MHPLTPLVVTTALLLTNVACMAMEEGTYEVPGAPATAERPQTAHVADVSSLRPTVLPTPPLATASSLNNPPVIVPGCDDARALPVAPNAPSASSTRNLAASPLTGRVSAPRNVPGVRPFVLLPSREDSVLQQKIKARLGDDAFDYGIVVKDLQTGRGTSLNADRVFFTASLFKIFVMLEVMHQEALGLLKLSDELTITPYYDSHSVGPRLTSLCQRLTVRQALEAMMARSDNAAAILLQDLVGSGNINQTMVSLNLRNSHFLSEDLPTSAGDLARLLEGIGRFQAVSKSSSEEMVRLLTLEQFDNGLRAGTPPAIRVAHKTGNYQGVTHDAGIVYGPAGAYLVIVLSDNANPTGVTKDIATLVFDHFSQSTPQALSTPRASR